MGKDHDDMVSEVSLMPRGDKPTPSETPPTSLESTMLDWYPETASGVRQSRSQSLTGTRSTPEAPSSNISVGSVSVEGDGARSVSFLVVDTVGDPMYDELVAQRRMRRTKSAEHCASLSLLQQELGYPKPQKTSFGASDGKATPTDSRHRRGSRCSRHSGNGELQKEEPYGRPAASSDAPTLETSYGEDDPVPDDEEENFLDHRLASVTGYARDTDGVVYYEIVVESTAHGPLSAYKVRRRYSEFRELHRALANLKSKHDHQRRYEARLSLDDRSQFSASGYCLNDSDSTDPVRSLSRSLHEHLSSSTRWLPPMPDNGGLWSYFQGENPRFLANRTRVFHAIITAAQQHSEARASRLLNKFLGPPPDSFASSNYVSLNRFAAPTLRFSIEIQERKEKAKTISLKRRQLDSNNVATSPPRVISPSIAE